MKNRDETLHGIAAQQQKAPRSSSDTTLLAVYGTLKHGRGLHYMLADQRYHGPQYVRGYLQASGAPRLFDRQALVARYGTAQLPEPADVYTEVYSVEQQTLAEVDAIETIAGYYRDEIATDYGTARIYLSPVRFHRPDAAYIASY